MAIITSRPSSSVTLRDRFFALLIDVLQLCMHQRVCPELPDADWLRLGVNRCLQPHMSGRGYLQAFAADDPDLCPGISHFFESLKSRRRLDLCADVNARVCAHAGKVLPDALAVFPQLAGFDVYAADGHFHEHACHDPADDQGRKHATGHLYARNLRTGCLSHLTVADQIARDKEHDMRALKRLPIDTLRQGACKGRKVLYVYDRAGIDFRQWHAWKQGSGIYWLSRCKDNMAPTRCGDLAVDHDDPMNEGVQRDERVETSHGVTLRRITFHDVISGRTFEFITNVMGEVAPGVLAHLYRMRWDIEKAFDELKNKLHEQKAWATSATAKSMQAQFMCLTFNLLTLMEHDLKVNEGIVNEPELDRKAKRLDQAQAAAAKSGRRLPQPLLLTQRITQHSVKLIRWVAARLWRHVLWKDAITALTILYASL